MFSFFYTNYHTRAHKNTHTHTHFFAIFSGLAESSAREVFYQHRLSTNVDSGRLPLMALLLKVSRFFEMEITIKVFYFIQPMNNYVFLKECPNLY